MAAKTLPKELLNLMCCPLDKGDLKYDKGVQTLTCKVCKTIYPIKDNIPVLLLEN